MTDLKRVETTITKLREDVARAHGRATESDVNAALQFASEQIDAMFRWRGEKADPNQTMGWPRKGVFDDQGNPVSGVPERVQDATYLMAGYRLLGNILGRGDAERDRDVIIYLLMLLNGLTDPREPMNPPSGARH